MSDAVNPQRSTEWMQFVSDLRHRVSNNLQMMTSVISLQASMATEPQVASALRSAQNRVRALAGVYGLHSTPDLAALHFGSYLEWLVPGLVAEYGVSGRVDLDLQTSDMAVPMDDGIPLALIASELVSNAVEHGLPDGVTGKISVRLAYADPTGAVGAGELTVGDEGGPIAGTDFETAATTGFTLIRALTLQLHATLRLEQQPGGKLFRLTFPLEDDGPE